MYERFRTFLVSRLLTRTLLRLIPSGPTVEVYGRGTCRIPASLVPFIVENIDENGIHEHPCNVRLDGGRLHDLRGKPTPTLSLRQMVGLHDAGDVGLESAAMSFKGDVVIETTDAAMTKRAHERGAATGFAQSRVILGMAAYAAKVSGRPLSGAC